MGVLTMNIDSNAHKKIMEDLIMPAIALVKGQRDHFVTEEFSIKAL